MSLSNGSVISKTSTAPRSSVTVLLSNLRLLDLHKRTDWPNVSEQVLSSKESTQIQRKRMQCVEWICYHLYNIWNPAECQRELLPFFPPLEPLQSINLRTALFKFLSALKKDGILPPETIIRRSMFDECKGEAFLKLLSAFSMIVLQKVLASETIYTKSIAGWLASVDKIRLEDRHWLLPLLIAHRVSLIALLREKRTLKARLRDFGNALENKDQDLLRKFEKIVETQDFLDKNPPSESTLDRVSRVLNQHWQGDQRLVDIIVQSEEHQMDDALLDNEFEGIWQTAITGKFGGNIGKNQHGLLEDLERRVATQQARLDHWRSFKGDLEKKEPAATEKKHGSPAAKVLISPKSLRYEQRNEKELVFSPRKSPRKSTWPELNPIDPATIENQDNVSLEVALADSKLDNSSPLTAKSMKVLKALSADVLIHGSFDEEREHCSFSEISSSEFDRPKAGLSSRLPKSLYDSSVPGQRPATSKVDVRYVASVVEVGASVNGAVVHIPPTSNCEDALSPEKINEDERLREHLTLNASNDGPTTGNSHHSLIERSRQSTAFGSPDKSLPKKDKSSLDPHVPNSEDASPTQALTAASLADRTRQSISLLPAKSRRPRDSIHVRRRSKIFPTNQFETPRKPPQVRRLTPPEEIISPRAGYDSVFKSRPKVAMSPTYSPDSGGQSPGGLKIINDRVADADQ